MSEGLTPVGSADAMAGSRQPVPGSGRADGFRPRAGGPIDPDAAGLAGRAGDFRNLPLRDRLAGKTVTGAQEASRAELDTKALRDGAEGFNKMMSAFHKSLRFKVFEDSGRVYAQVVDDRTGDVIKELPPRELMEVMARINESIGILVDTEL